MVIKEAPDLVSVYCDCPDTKLLIGTSAIVATAPCLVIVFTTDPDADKIALATRSGLHAYVVNGYSQTRLWSVVHLAQAGFRQKRAARVELTELNQRMAKQARLATLLPAKPAALTRTVMAETQDRNADASEALLA